MTEKKFNTYLTYLMLLCIEQHDLRLQNIEKSNYVRITDGSIYGREYVTIEREGDNHKITSYIRKRRK